MISKMWKKRLVAAAFGAGISLTAALICMLIYTITAGKGSMLIAAAAILCAVSAVCVAAAISFIRRETEYFRAFEANLKDYAFIRYDKAAHKACLNMGVAPLTGIETTGVVLDQAEYESFMEKLKNNPYDTAENIYKSAAEDKWIQISSYSTPRYDCTAIRDVSSYISCKSVIKSLKYYDSVTGALSRDAFISRLRSAGERNSNSSCVGIINFVISGIERITSFTGTAAADSIIVRIAQYIKKYENPHNIFVGRTGANEFSMLVTDTYDDGCRKTAEKVYDGLAEMLLSDNKNNVRIFCGYACFHGSGNNINSMMSAADFAVFDAESQGEQKPVPFDSETYAKRAHDFKKIQVFNKAVSEQLIDYHFQPIVNAKTGAIYGYEALMRPRMVDGIKLTPLEMLKYAAQQDMLYNIEHITFFGTMKLLSENQDFFSTRKLFINCIPNSILSDDDFATLTDNYGTLFDKVVVEITEGSPVFNSAMEVLNGRFRSRKAQIALDDYGTGYANESTLLTVKPDYIKIDRSLMQDIDKDVQKQHLVANMINFATQHGIKTLGEGIETLNELETAVSLGIDLIQGYVACRPAAVLMLDIPIDIKNAIIEYNLKYTGRVDKTYEVTGEEPVNIVELALAGYNELLVTGPKAVIEGDADIEVNMHITIMVNGCEAHVTLKNVNIASPGGPTVTIEKGSEVNLCIEGSNTLTHEGIRVPEGAKLFISGGGDLSINCTRNDAPAIGSGFMQEYGVINICSEGNISMNVNGDSFAAIGGGIATENSEIVLISGRFSFILKCKDVVGIGSFSGPTKISVARGVKVDMTIGCQNAVAIGSRNGNADIDCSGDISTNISGDTCCCIGTLERGESSIKVNGGDNNIVVRGKHIAGVGAINGQSEILLNAGKINILCEGDNATCVGDAFGSGLVRIWGSQVTAIAKASHENPIGVKDGKVYVMGGSIVTSNLEPLECTTEDGAPLVRTEVDGKKKFTRTVQGAEQSYLYTAEPTGEEKMYIYLPEGTQV